MHSPSKEQRVLAVICISSSFLLLELIIGFRNHSLALVADAFHVASDVIGFTVALVAIRKRKSADAAPSGFSFGWQRAELLGGFFNGVFLLALGVSVLLQTIEHFISPVRVTQPKLILITGGIGLGLNALSALVLGGHGHAHGHSHSHGHDDDHKQDDDALDLAVNPALHVGHAHLALSARKEHADLGVLGVLIHLVGDAINNVAVMVSAGVFIATGFVYADPIASAFVGLMIVGTSLPLMLRAGRILLDSAPIEVNLEDVGKDIRSVSGIEGVHEMHIWSLTQDKALATVHVVTSNDSVSEFMAAAQRINECLHHWGVHNTVIQPEVRASYAPSTLSLEVGDERPTVPASRANSTCQLRCLDARCTKEVCCD